MKLYRELIKLLFNHYIRRLSKGEAIKIFAENMGIVYIKLAQILAMQNIGNLFTEQDRRALSEICDHCQPIPFSEVTQILQNEYAQDLDQIFSHIDPKPLGSASIAQVHAATLVSGEKVALKVQRTGITQHIERDVRQIRRLMHRFGRFVHFGNYMGGEKGLDLYLQWILEETDFQHEAQNLQSYTEFAAKINQTAHAPKRIVTPKLYADLSTSRVIVLEFIEHKTINRLELSPANRQKICTALDSYISASFHALLHDSIVIFHGDPHGGNLYLDNEGNIGFLDFGLTFVLSPEDIEYSRAFFFAAFKQDSAVLLELVRSFGQLNQKQLKRFRRDVQQYCDDIPHKTITAYFVDMMMVCLKYEICPPNFLFCMAKSFLCLNGINQITDNSNTASVLLKRYVAEFYIERSLNETKDVLIEGAKILPHALQQFCQTDLTGGVATFIAENRSFIEHAKSAIKNYEEIINLV